MKVKDAYKLKRFGTYLIEIDSDNQKHIEEFDRKLRSICRWRFIKFIIVPMGVVKLIDYKEVN